MPSSNQSAGRWNYRMLTIIYRFAICNYRLYQVIATWPVAAAEGQRALYATTFELRCAANRFQRDQSITPGEIRASFRLEHVGGGPDKSSGRRSRKRLEWDSEPAMRVTTFLTPLVTSATPTRLSPLSGPPTRISVCHVRAIASQNKSRISHQATTTRERSKKPTANGQMMRRVSAPSPSA